MTVCSQSELGNVRTAIVIDDNIDLRDVFVELLKLRNINVVGVGANGCEAFDLYVKHDPDIVLMDAMMPQCDGFYGLMKIKDFDPKAIVILLTGLSIEKGRLDTCNASAFIEKPVDMDEIQRIIGKLCIHLDLISTRS